MNKISKERQALILMHLVEGCSIRATERMTGTSRNTVLKTLLTFGEAAQEQLDRYVVDLKPNFMEVDEIWAYVFKKQKGLTLEEKRAAQIGDQYVWIAMDAETKLVACHLVGKRNHANAVTFLEDLKERVQPGFQMTTDSYSVYTDTVWPIFGDSISYAQIHKEYEQEITKERRYSPAKVTGIKIIPMIGEPDPSHISTSYIERQNLTIRMQNRRFTRLTNAFSKKLENLKSAVALHMWHYNFCRVHMTLRYTPAMAAGLTKNFWDWDKLFV